MEEDGCAGRSVRTVQRALSTWAFEAAEVEGEAWGDGAFARIEPR